MELPTEVVWATTLNRPLTNSNLLITMTAVIRHDFWIAVKELTYLPIYNSELSELKSYRNLMIFPHKSLGDPNLQFRLVLDAN